MDEKLSMPCRQYPAVINFNQWICYQLAQERGWITVTQSLD